MTTILSRRSILGGLAAAPVAAFPAAVAAAAAAVSDEPDWTAVSARVDHVLTLLRERYICAGWKMDEATAADAVAYVNDRLAGLPEDDESWLRFIMFVHQHGQSLDYLLMGDVSALICSQACLSPQAVKSSADPIKERAKALAREMERCHGGQWKATVDHETGFILIKPKPQLIAKR